MPSPTVQAFHVQLGKLHRIAKVEGLDSGSKGLLRTALVFAESLLLCLTEDEARVQMRQDPEATRAFLQVAMGLDDLLSKAEIANAVAIAKPLPKESTPFYVVASGVQEYLNRSKDYFGDDW